jgi:murein DD-endopeptidase MepM/ murein hydrolase activator NlpD
MWGRIGRAAASAGVVVATVTAPSGWGTVAAAAGYDWPLRPRPAVVREFSPPPHRWEPGHRGLDLAAADGQQVFAAGPGTVHHVGRIDDRIVVSILHPNGLLSTYEPIDEPQVETGRTVTVGTVLGRVTVGHEGCGDDPCLHWGLRRGSGHRSRYYDPRLLTGAGRVRLLPQIPDGNLP